MRDEDDDVIIIGLLRDTFPAAELRRRLNRDRNDDAADDLLDAAPPPLPRRAAFSDRDRPSLLSTLPTTPEPA